MLVSLDFDHGVPLVILMSSCYFVAWNSLITLFCLVSDLTIPCVKTPARYGTLAPFLSFYIDWDQFPLLFILNEIWNDYKYVGATD